MVGFEIGEVVGVGFYCLCESGGVEECWGVWSSDSNRRLVSNVGGRVGEGGLKENNCSEWRERSRF